MERRSVGGGAVPRGRAWSASWSLPARAVGKWARAAVRHSWRIASATWLAHRKARLRSLLLLFLLLAALFLLLRGSTFLPHGGRREVLADDDEDPLPRPRSGGGDAGGYGSFRRSPLQRHAKDRPMASRSCRSAEVVAFARGDVAARAHTMCVARALSLSASTEASGGSSSSSSSSSDSGIGREVCVVWLREGPMTHVSPTDVFSNGNDFFVDAAAADPGLQGCWHEPVDQQLVCASRVLGAAKGFAGQGDAGAARGDGVVSSGMGGKLAFREVNVSLCRGWPAGGREGGGGSIVYIPELPDSSVSHDMLLSSRVVNAIAPSSTQHAQLPHLECRLQRLVDECMASLLQPSEQVNDIMIKNWAAGEGNAAAAAAASDSDGGSSAGMSGRLQGSTAVYVEDLPDDGSLPCGGCPVMDTRLNISAPWRCTLRRLAREFLRDPSVDFTVAAADAPAARWVESVFHPSRTPLVLFSTRYRSLFCPPSLSPAATAASAASSGSAHESEMHHGQWEQQQQQQRLRQPWWHWQRWSDAVQQKLASLSASVAGGKVFHSHVLVQQQQTCAQHQLAELLLLSETQGLLHMRPSVQAQFIASRGIAAATWRAGQQLLTLDGEIGQGGGTGGGIRGEKDKQARGVEEYYTSASTSSSSSSSASSFFSASSSSLSPSTTFQQHESICGGPRLRNFTKERFATFFVVEEKLNLAYCSVPKVACTSWKMWLRAMLNLTDPQNQYLAHSIEHSGLGDLAHAFSEEGAIRALTKRGVFKFVFVRNPYTRIMSTYLNKLVITDAPDRKTGWGTRAFWNQEFFSQVKPLFEQLRNKTTDLVSFCDFLRLIGELQKREVELDRHFATQVELCGLERIRYDFVGKFEDLQADVRAITARFDHQHVDMFEFGRAAHATDTDRKLNNFYTPESVRLIAELYTADFNVSLNNISYSCPSVLQRLVEDSNLS